jgi:hypothetical protein
MAQGKAALPQRSPPRVLPPDTPRLTCPALPCPAGLAPTTAPYILRLRALSARSLLHSACCHPCRLSVCTDAAVDAAIPRPLCYPPGHPRPCRACSLNRRPTRLPDHSTAHITCSPRPRYLDTLRPPLISGRCTANSGTCVLTAAPRSPNPSRLTCPASLRLCTPICTTEPPLVDLQSSAAPHLHPHPRSFLTKRRVRHLWGETTVLLCPLAAPRLSRVASLPAVPRRPTASSLPCYTACISPLPSEQ